MAGMWWLVLDHPVSDSESACRLRVGFWALCRHRVWRTGRRDL